MKVDKSKWVRKTLKDIVLTIQNINWRNNDNCYQYIDLTSVDRETKSIVETISINASNAPSRAKQIVNRGDVIFATTRPTQMRTAIISEKYHNQICSTGYCILRPSENSINSSFLFYCLQSNKFKLYLSLKEGGAAYPAVSNGVVLAYTILFPNLSIQQVIATELDSIQTMIDGYKAQLDDLDELAQSIFLDMFGDPVANPKGWEIDIFSNLFSLKSGECLSATQFTNGDFPVYGGNGITGFHNQYNKKGESIIIGRVGAKCGNVRLVKGLFWLTDNAFELFQKETLFDNIFLSKLLSLLNLGSKAKAMAQPVISNTALKNVHVILPPLDLQQQFSLQVESIEQQKELICEQLKDAETLMAERMQYYFS